MRVRAEMLTGGSESTFRLSNAGAVWLRESYRAPYHRERPILMNRRPWSRWARRPDLQFPPARQRFDDTILPQLHCF